MLCHISDSLLQSRPRKLLCGILSRGFYTTLYRPSSRSQVVEELPSQQESHYGVKKPQVKLEAADK